jgi:hypothetical protein
MDSWFGSEMSPPIEHSIVKTALGKWSIGSSMICESGLTGIPDTAVASWTNGDGMMYAISEISSSSLTNTIVEDVAELSQVDRVHKAGTSAAVWPLVAFTSK